ncbi:MAG: glycoside hydrolase family 16 protein [Oligosphaeraceae bacterium]|nr:glycoside hydrolase family 16 protein [Oligosphaeraceae bacterium]
MMQDYILSGHEPSRLPADKNWRLIWNDEFDGTELDTSKWGFRLNFWGQPFPAFTTEGVVLDGQSHLQLHVVKKGDQYCSPHLQTASLTYDLPKDTGAFWPFGRFQKPKFLHKYGFYEIRCRLNRQAGWWTAFWLQSPAIGAHPDPRQCGVECDIMESQEFATRREIRCGNIWNGYGHDCTNPGHARFILGETPGDWHRFAVDWSRNGYVFYADDQIVHRETAAVSDVEQFILVSTECMGYRRNPPVPDPRLQAIVLPEYFEVDYVRVFDQC